MVANNDNFYYRKYCSPRYENHKPHHMDEIYIVNLDEGHWWTEKVPDFIEKFNNDQLGLDVRIHSTNQIFLCWYEEQAREMSEAIIQELESQAQDG